MGICDNLKTNDQEKFNPNNKVVQPKNLNILEQAIPKGIIPPLPKEKEEKITKQLEIYICKINLYGTGFLCNIPFPDEFNYLPVLITNKNIINKDELLDKKKIEITFDNDRVEKIINITNERRIYSSTKNDITFIEIFPEIDDIHQFLEIDILNDIYGNEDIYILQYLNGKECVKSYGKIININDKEDVIYHNCSSNPGGPILLIDNLQVIGINMQSGKGTLLRESILLEFYKFSKNIEVEENNQINCIDCYYKIENEKEFYLLYDYNKDIGGKEVRKLYNEAKKKKKFLEENTNIYIDSKPIKFSFKYKTNNNKIHVKFIFKQILNDLSFMFFCCSNLESIDLSSFKATNITNMCSMFFECSNLKYVNLSSFKTNKAINMSYMFFNCPILKSIELPSFEKTNIKINVINISKMFFNCTSLESIDLSSFNTINIQDMNNLFFRCLSLKSINISSFNTSNVINMEKMFCECECLRSIDLSKFNTKNVSNMTDMFLNCKSLISLDLSSFNTANVKNMSGMFMFCNSLKSINLSSFNTINVIDMSLMFCGCESLISIDVSSFNTRNVTNMNSMFSGCTSLKTLDLSSFEIPNVEIIDFMFINCKKLESIDLSAFDTKGKKMITSLPFIVAQNLNEGQIPYNNIFFGCFLLKRVKCKDKYILEMFQEIKQMSDIYEFLLSNQE